MIEFDDDQSLQVPAPDPMTPMIDVIFALIAFMMLMINAPLLKLDMSLPKTPPKSERSYADSEFITLAILADKDSYQLNEQTLNIDALEHELQQRQQQGEFKLMLKTDANTPVQRMVDTLALLNRLKISNAQIALNNEAQ